MNDDFSFFESLLGSGAFHARAKAIYPALKPRHSQVLHLLLKREFVSNEGLQTVLDQNTLKGIHNYIHFVRKITQAQITNTYGIGYSMKLEDRKRLTQEIGNLA